MLVLFTYNSRASRKLLINMYYVASPIDSSVWNLKHFLALVWLSLTIEQYHIPFSSCKFTELQ
jgi:hypothetical protein